MRIKGRKFLAISIWTYQSDYWHRYRAFSGKPVARVVTPLPRCLIATILVATI